MGSADADADADVAAAIRVIVACSEHAGAAFEVSVDVASDATVLDAIRGSGVLGRFATIDVSRCEVGIWGRATTLGACLADGDRVELYRPLVMDPMQARRLRATRRPAARR